MGQTEGKMACGNEMGDKVGAVTTQGWVDGNIGVGKALFQAACWAAYSHSQIEAENHIHCDCSKSHQMKREKNEDQNHGKKSQGWADVINSYHGNKNL